LCSLLILNAIPNTLLIVFFCFIPEPIYIQTNSFCFYVQASFISRIATKYRMYWFVRSTEYYERINIPQFLPPNAHTERKLLKINSHALAINDLHALISDSTGYIPSGQFSFQFNEFRQIFLVDELFCYTAFAAISFSSPKLCDSLSIIPSLLIAFLLHLNFNRNYWCLGNGFLTSKRCDNEQKYLYCANIHVASICLPAVAILITINSNLLCVIAILNVCVVSWIMARLFQSLFTDFRLPRLLLPLDLFGISFGCLAIFIA
jgi:hypothetical protein